MGLQKNNHDIYHRVLNKRKELLTYFNSDEIYPKPNEIDEVIVILGSSRSGSSLLHHLLSMHPDIISLQGEEVAFTKLFGLNAINSFEDSDELEDAHLSDSTKLHELASMFLTDAGYNTTEHHRLPLDRSLRITIQWPHINFKNEDIFEASKLSEWNAVIASLKSKDYEINLNYYDQYLNNFEFLHTHLIEEPPFIIPKPKSYKAKKPKKTVLLKSSINAFRPKLLKHLYPNAQFRFIHLTRNPAASINGLIDGWLSPGFHTHNVSHLTTLSIKGYSNSDWWKFDLPPGWKEYTNKTLVEVCAFQWQSANQSILNFLNRQESVHIKYEDMLSNEDMLNTLKKICHEFSLDKSYLSTLAKPPLIMSVNKPNIYRWREREEQISSVIHFPSLRVLSREIGYDVTKSEDLK